MEKGSIATGAGKAGESGDKIVNRTKTSGDAWVLGLGCRGHTFVDFHKMRMVLFITPTPCY